MEKKKTKKRKKAKLIIVNPTEIYLTKAEELSLRLSLKDLNNIRREFAIVNIVEIIEKANKRKDIKWVYNKLKQEGCNSSHD